MKHIVIFLLLTPSIVFAQSEFDQKMAKKYGNNSLKNTNTEVIQKKQERFDNNNKEEKTDNVYHPSPFIFSENYNWVRWGAPVYGYSNFYPTFYYDRFGLRHPSRIYEYNTGKRDTIKGKKLHWRLGLSYNTKNQFGGWISIGNRNFFMSEYCTYISNDESYFYSDITMNEIITWNDQQLDDILLGGVIYLGGGIKLNKFGVYVMPGYGWDKRNFQFFDELYILSNNGKYSINNYNKKYVTGKFGVIFDYKYVSSKLDYNPFTNVLSFGVGIVL